MTDEELTVLALAADPDVEVGDDAVDIAEVLGPVAPSPLPSWYMPAPMGVRRLTGWRRALVRCSAASVIASFVVINACGLCNTYGQLHL
jgi:hypothetical protein